MAGVTAPNDVSEAFETGNARTVAYQTSGSETRGGVRLPTQGQGDAHTVLTSPTPVDPAGIHRVMDDMQAATADARTDSTGAIAQLTQVKPAIPGGASFDAVIGVRGDYRIFLVKTGADNVVTVTDLADNVPTDQRHGYDFGGMGEPGANNVWGGRVDLKPGEKATTLVFSDGAADGFLGKPGQMQQEMEAYARANPGSGGWGRFLAERAESLGVVDNVTALSTNLSPETDLKGRSVTMAVFDQVNHDENDVSLKLARSLETALPGAVRPAPVAREEYPHVLTRAGDLARVAEPGAADPHAAGPGAGPQGAEAPVSKFAGPVRVQAKLGGVSGKAGVLLDIADGNYTVAALSAGQQVLLNPEAVKGAAALAHEIEPVAKALGEFSKRIPVVGAAVTVGYVAYEAGSDVVHGEWGKAGAATVAGAAEAGGNLLGFGVGDVARETVREGVILTAGENYAPDKSGLRVLGEHAYDVGTRLLEGDPRGAPADAAALAARQAQLVDGDPVLPKTVRFGEEDVALSAALRDPGFSKAFRASLVRADGRDGLDLSSQLKAVDEFSRLEDQRRALPGAAAAPGPGAPPARTAPNSTV